MTHTLSLAALAALALAGICTPGALPAHDAPAPFIIEAIDANGEAWGAGAGDTCAEAARDMVLPAHVVTIRCVRI